MTFTVDQIRDQSNCVPRILKGQGDLEELWMMHESPSWHATLVAVVVCHTHPALAHQILEAASDCLIWVAEAVAPAWGVAYGTADLNVICGNTRAALRGDLDWSLVEQAVKAAGEAAQEDYNTFDVYEGQRFGVIATRRRPALSGNPVDVDRAHHALHTVQQAVKAAIRSAGSTLVDPQSGVESATDAMAALAGVLHGQTLPTTTLNPIEQRLYHIMRRAMTTPPTNNKPLSNPAVVHRTRKTV